MNGVLTSQGTLSYGVDTTFPPDFVGIEDSGGIDRIMISSPGGGLFAIDDVQLDAIPEPAALALLALAAGVSRNRRIRSALHRAAAHPTDGAANN